MKGKINLTLIIAVALFLSTGLEKAFGIPVTLQNGTATFSQTCCTGPFTPDLSVDGDFSSVNKGWAIATFSGTGDATSSQTAVWETTTDVDATQLDFRMSQNFASPALHLIGRFRFSVTSDDRSTFADGLDSGGDVTANWTILTNPLISGPGGMTFASLGDNSILVGGSVPNTGIYDLQYSGNFLGITGLRLEVLEDFSLPFNGPGLQPINGNFVLSELEVSSSGSPDTMVSVPEPKVPSDFLVLVSLV
jgi:hypothetical protein